MRFQFRNRSYSICEPVASDDEVIMRVENYASFHLPPDAKSDRFRFSHAFSKIVFFLLREGPFLTFQKVRATMLQRKVLAEKAVVLAYGRSPGTENHMIAVGCQDCPSAEYLVFPACCSMTTSRSDNFEIIFEKLASLFRDEPRRIESLYHYSRFSGTHLDFDLREILANLDGIDSTGNRQVPAVPPLEVVHSQDSVVQGRSASASSGETDLFLAGAGAYAYAYILPTLRGVCHNTLVDLNPVLACIVGEKYGFHHVDTHIERALKRIEGLPAPILVVATYHSTHLPIVEQALKLNPGTKIFIEKPPVTSYEQLQRLLELRQGGAFIEIGFNRRYSPFIKLSRNILAEFSGPIVMTCIVKELEIPKTHWYYWPSEGTRITGNLCHWLDLGVYCIDRQPVSMHVVSASEAAPGDEVSVVVIFSDGSRLTVIATDKGNSLRGVQEYIDIRRGGLTVTIDDFITMSIQREGSTKVYRRLIRDKGHATMYREFMQTVSFSGGPVYPDKHLKWATCMYLAAKDAAIDCFVSEINMNDVYNNKRVNL